MSETETVVAVVPGAVAMTPSVEVQADEESIGRSVTDIGQRAESVVITNDADYEVAGQLGVLLKKKAAEVKAFFKPLKDAAHQTHKSICDRENAMLAPLKAGEDAVRKAMGAYNDERERKRRELEEMYRKAAERERERKLDEAAELDSAGDAAGAQVALDEAVAMDAATAYSEPAIATPKPAGVSTTKDWEITAIDESKVPVMLNGVVLRPVDTAAAMRLIRAMKGNVTIPGVSFREKTRMIFRGGK